MIAARKRPHYTPTHKRMLAVLRDGQPHSREEMHACLWDELSKRSAIQRHLSTLRALLRPRRDIIVQYYKRSLYYRLIRLVS